MINALQAPVEAAWAGLRAAADAAAAVPARIRLGEIAPDMARLEAEVKQITHAIRMAACNAETALARALRPGRRRGALCKQLNQAQACYPGTDLVLRYEVKPHPGIA